jgi:hypothetical protein
MIEFKADCGHTVRAKDEDAGKVVRCAYCGREAQVPDDDETSDFDLLFSDIQETTAGAKLTGRAKRKKDREASAGATKRRGAGQADPFGVVVKMAYIAAILVFVIFVGRKWVVPIIRDLSSDSPASSTADAPKKPSQQSTTAATAPKSASPRSSGMGLINPRLDRRGKEGIFVNPVPASAEMYYRKAASADRGTKTKRGDPFEITEWLNDSETVRVANLPSAIDLEPGRYDVVVMIAINDPAIKKYRALGYREFREKVEGVNLDRTAEANQAGEVASDYFLPDSAVSVEVADIRDLVYIVRRYEVSVRKREWQVLTALFLPRCCKIREYKKYLPRQRSYRFDKDDIRDELLHYDVADGDIQYVIDTLESIGAISYASKIGKHYRMFKIGHSDGRFTAPFLNETMKETDAHDSR